MSDILKRKEELKNRREEVSALILCPNATLCDQVKAAIDALTYGTNSDGDSNINKPLVKTVALTPDRGLPSSFPDIIVCTPARAEQDVLNWREGSWRSGSFTPYVKNIRTVVLDEADMLLGGGYQRKVRNCFDVLFREEKLAAQKGFYALYDDDDAIDSDENNERRNNDTNNKKVVTRKEQEQEEIEWNRDLDRSEAAMEQNWRKDHDFENDENDDDDDDDDDENDNDDFDEDNNDNNDNNNTSISSSSIKKKKKKPKARLGGKGKVGKGTNRDFRRQYVFAAATVMSTGKRTPGAVLKFGFPDAVWTKSASLHKPRAELTQEWMEVSIESRAKALFDALQMDSETSKVQKTLVFVNSGTACDAITKELRNLGAKVCSFHSEVEPAEREIRLKRFALQGDDDVDDKNDEVVDVLVATDAVARGVDIPNVKHVIQAEFAQNATEYLHRVGRTARAGKLGRATNILLPGDLDLANAIRKADREGQSVEDTFSRKRSFRNKFKKYGESRRA